MLVLCINKKQIVNISLILLILSQLRPFIVTDLQLHSLNMSVGALQFISVIVISVSHVHCLFLVHADQCMHEL